MLLISERRVRDDKAGSIINKVIPGWSWTITATTTIRGRIWMVWDPMKVSFTMLETAEQYKHGELSSHARGGNSYLL